MPAGNLSLDTSVSKLHLVGPAYARRLEKLGIRSIKDLLYHLPARYDDFSLISKISRLQEGETVTVRGRVLEMKNIFTPRGFVLQKAAIEDETGKIDVMWFNQRFLTRTIHKDDLLSLSGKVEKNSQKLQLQSPQYEVLYPSKEKSLHTGRLVPVYPETEGISSKWLRNRINSLLMEIKAQKYDLKDFLDQPTREDEKLMSLEDAVYKVHFPDSLEEATKARRRLAFDELLIAQLEARFRKNERQKKTVGNKFEIAGINQKLKALVDKLPFELTGSQKKVINEIYQDLSKETPMNRLLQGDVGSGKTVVAALAMLAACRNGYQAALMAPTEILATQHYLTLSELLKPLGVGVGIATGSKKDFENSDIIVGTHALLSDKLNFEKLGLVVIDEQHRFGVSQRAILTGKGTNPHVLTMTATPIPRTIALTLYGDLDLSVIDELPKNRLPIKTWVVPEPKRTAAYEWIKNQNTQCFIICPFIEESETLTTVKAAKTEFENIKKIFPGKKVGLVHGRLKDKDKILNDFRNLKLDILVATPVVEVGIDIPSASIMVIEAADRFGLAQLHQLRGRVGRGNQQSYCLMFAENGADRLKFMENHHHGMELAEIDLRFRGPGQRFGTAQHGRWDLKIADFSDLNLIEKTNLAAQKMFANLEKFPLLRETLVKSKIKVVAN